MTTLLLLLSLLLPPRAETQHLASLSAHWTGPRAIELRWNTPGCLYRKPLVGPGVFLGCHAAGAMWLPGDGPNDWTRFPRLHDRYLLLTDHGDVEAGLEWWVFAPVVRSGEGQRWAVALPLAGR